MDNINTVIILILVTLCIVLLFLKFKEDFTNIINPRDYVTDDLSNSELIETQQPEFQIMVNDMVDQLLDELNRLYNKQLIRINVERVEKTQLNDTLSNYNVSTFVFNSAKDSSAKLMLTFDVENDLVTVKGVEVVGSRPSLFKKRQGESARDSLKVSRKVDIDKVKPTYNQPLHNSDVNFKETSTKMVDRHSWILPIERQRLGNISTFPNKEVLPEWDVYGVELTDETSDPTRLGGLNHGTRKLTFVPNFYKNNFQADIGNYLWLFDTAEDVVGNPVGGS
jgi:hypothetical protein